MIIVNIYNEKYKDANFITTSIALLGNISLFYVILIEGQLNPF